MTPRTRILSFDEVRSLSEREDRARAAVRFDARGNARRASSAGGGRTPRIESARAPRVPSAARAARDPQASRDPYGVVPVQPISFEELRERAERRGQDRPAPRAAVYGGEEAEEPRATKGSKRAQAKKRRAKEKAGRAFAKQFGDAGSAAPSPDAPRAALYKGEMGRRHRQAARLQDGPASGRAKAGWTGAAAGRKSRPRLAAALVALGCFVLACVLMYPTAQQYYITLREHDQLQAEYSALEQRNAAIEAEVNALATDEGIEDKAREDFGWVKEGEQTATVVGLDSDGVQESAYKDPVVPGSVEAPATWYSPILDVIFGVS